MIGGRVASLVSTVGTSLIVRTVTTTTSAIGGSIAHITSYDQPGVLEVTAKLTTIDLDFKVKVIEELVREQESGVKDGEEFRPSVKKAMIGVLEILENIRTELTVIEEAIRAHEDKYWKNWRSFDCTCNIKTIEAHTKILDQRYAILRDLLLIYGH